jgi:hypothetical protein
MALNQSATHRAFNPRAGLTLAGATASILGCLLLATVATPGIAQPYEQPPRLRAGDVLPANLVQGPDFRFRDEVVNDGVLNIFTLDSTFGTFQATTNAKARDRVAEVHALRQMETIRQSDTFVQALKQSGRGTINTVTGVVTDPIGTVSGAISGVGKAFARTGDALFGSRRSEAEGSRMEALVGIEASKRKFAFDFGVDVYSDNPVLQDRLDDLARANVLGGLSYSAALAIVPGTVGVAATATGLTQRAHAVYRTTAPNELRAMNEQKLKAMGMRADVVEAYVENGKFSPREQTEIVFALERMPTVKRRDLFILLATLTRDRDMAFFRQRQAEMYAGFHMKTARIDTMVPFGDFVGSRTQAGEFVFNLPVDHLVWTKSIADTVAAIDQMIAGLPGGGGKRLVTAGSLSALARQQLAGRGWAITENAEALIDVR